MNEESTAITKRTIQLQLLLEHPDGTRERLADDVSLPLAADTADGHHAMVRTREIIINIPDDRFRSMRASMTDRHRLHVLLRSAGVTDAIAIQGHFILRVPPKTFGIVLGAVILVGMYVLIILNAVHHTFAALLAATAGVAALAYVGERPTLKDIMAWVEVETLMMLFGMMIFVAIMAQTGAFDYLAVLVFRVTGGRVWPLLFTLAALTFGLVAIVDNVTVVLLLTPVIIRLCEVVELNPVPVLIMQITMTNVMGIATPLGDPPNILILTNAFLVQNVRMELRIYATHKIFHFYNRDALSSLQGMTFSVMLAHMLPGVLLTIAAIGLQYRFWHFRRMSTLKFQEHAEVIELRHEIVLWKQTVLNMSTAYTHDEDAMHTEIQRKIEQLEQKLNRKIYADTRSRDTYTVKLNDLEVKVYEQKTC